MWGLTDLDLKIANIPLYYRWSAKEWKQLKDVSCCLLDTAGVTSLYYILDYTD